jgi:lipid A disaccharide synthetase
VVKALFPDMLESAKQIVERSNSAWCCPPWGGPETLALDFLAPFLQIRRSKCGSFSGLTHKLQNAADVRRGRFGTASLETALMLTPMVVIYRTQFFDQSYRHQGL